MTFFLVRTNVPPVLNLDIDANDNGYADPGGPISNWQILDSVGITHLGVVLDGHGYGRINFIHAPGVKVPAGSTAVLLGDEATYVGRIGNSTGSTASDWVASKPEGGAPNFMLSSVRTSPALLAGAVLRHIGSANFVTRPDGLIGTRKRQLSGNNRYNPSGAGQKVAARAGGPRKMKFYWQLQNDGRVKDFISLSGTRGNSKFTAKYYKDGGGNVTAQVIRGAYSGEIGIAAKESGRLEVKPKRKGRKTFQMKSASQVDAGNRDTIKATAMVK